MKKNPPLEILELAHDTKDHLHRLSHTDPRLALTTTQILVLETAALICTEIEQNQIPVEWS